MTAPIPRRPGGDQQIPRPDVWTEHHEPPWPLGARWTLEELVGPLPEHSAPLLPSFPDARVSAVLIALVDAADGPEVLLTRRSMELRNHRGEISFPGGRVDPGVRLELRAPSVAQRRWTRPRRRRRS